MGIYVWRRIVFFVCDDTPSAIDHEGDESLSPKTKTYFDNIHFIENLF